MKTIRFFRALVLIVALVSTGAVRGADTNTAFSKPEALQAVFLKLCDLSCEELSKPSFFDPEELGYVPDIGHRAYYMGSYSIRALAVAYDLTGEKRYLDACQLWADKMIDFQERMSPSGAYYMHYDRRPGDTTGDWFTADSSCIAMAVLATAVRTADHAKREKYIQSVKSFADLVLKSYVRGGGITDGIWREYDGPWWCSTGTFGSLSFLLYGSTGEQKYLDAGLGAIDWLNAQNFHQQLPVKYNLDQQGPSFLMYAFEAYAAGLSYLEPTSARHKKALERIEESVDWMPSNLRGLGATKTMDYNSQWGSKVGGMPFLLYVWSRYRPEGYALSLTADRELAFTTSIMFDESRFKEDRRKLSQLMNFTMMSLAEKIRPGYLYRR